MPSQSAPWSSYLQFSCSWEDRYLTTHPAFNWLRWGPTDVFAWHGLEPHMYICVYMFCIWEKTHNNCLWEFGLFYLTKWSQVQSIFLQMNNFILLYGWIILHWVHIPYFCIYLSADGHLGWLLKLSRLSKVCKNFTIKTEK
jgi:hypothetical protein